MNYAGLVYKDLKKIKRCNNNCIFCFIKQLPDNLRPSLYIKDDDYLHSYMYGNFVTLTNINKSDMQKIIKYRLEPLNISVHSLDNNIRKKLFGSSRHINGLKNLKLLDDNKIHLNIQIVSCPGLNGWKDIKKTIYRLLKDYRSIISIGIVPVGITKYNKEKSLISYNDKKSKYLIENLDDFKKKYRNELNTSIVNLSDEFYIISGKEIPGYSYYDNFYQLNNGVGKSAVFIKEVKDSIKNNKKNKDVAVKKYYEYLRSSNKKLLVFTSEYAEKILDYCTGLFLDGFGLKYKDNRKSIKIVPVKNTFLGGNVKVAGLITGSDIIRTIKKINTKELDKIFIPDSIFNYNFLTLDDFSKKELSGISKKIIFVKEDGMNFTKQLMVA